MKREKKINEDKNIKRIEIIAGNKIQDNFTEKLSPIHTEIKGQIEDV